MPRKKAENVSAKKKATTRKKTKTKDEKPANVSKKSPYFKEKTDSDSVPSFIRKRLSKAKMEKKAETKAEKPKSFNTAFEPKEECIENDDTFPQTPVPPSEDALQLKRLLALEKVEQRTEAWYALRKTMITASDWAKAIGKACSGNKNDLILKKCNMGPKFKGNQYTQWGVKYEPVATRLYELRNGTIIHEFGVLRHPKYPFLGASPDGISPLGIMLEIKCPFTRKITGIVPQYYWVQIQGQLEVCDLQYCDFLECRIEEYCGLEDYLRDTCEGTPVVKYDTKMMDSELKEKYRRKRVFQFTEDGMEKGAVVTYVTKSGDKEYVYSEIGVDAYEFDRWYKEQKADMRTRHPHWTEVRVSFWRMKQISCVRVPREREWFASVLPTLTQVWKEIEHYRDVGCESLMKKQKDHGEMIEEPDQQDFNKVLHHKDRFDGLDDLASSFLSGHLGDGAESVTVEPISMDDDPEMAEVMEAVRLHSERVGEVKEARPPEPPKEDPRISLSLGQLEAISDLELASWLLPRYMPVSPRVTDQRAIEELLTKLSGMCKMITRCKTALVRLVKTPKEVLESSSYPLKNIVHNIDVWMNGIPNLLTDFLEKTDVDLPEDMLEAVRNGALVATKWNESWVQKWNKLWDQDNIMDMYEKLVNDGSSSDPSTPTSSRSTPSPDVPDHLQDIDIPSVITDVRTRTSAPSSPRENSKAGAAIVKEKPKPKPKPLTLEDMMKKSLQELVPDKYREVMEGDYTEEEREQKLEFLESMKKTYARLELYRYNA